MATDMIKYAFDHGITHFDLGSINKLLPAKMIPVIIELSGIDPDKKVNEISKEERNRLLMLFKKLHVTLNGPRGYNEAIITKGGIKVKEINPSTMESKLVNGLYFADVYKRQAGCNIRISKLLSHCLNRSK